MARSSTTFGPGNKAGFKLGNQLGVRHGADTPAVIEGRIPAKIDELFLQMPWLIEADREGVKSFAHVCIQEDLLIEYLDRDDGGDGRGGRGRLFTRDGMPRKIATLWKEVQLAKREWMKVLAMGPAPRSQYAQQMAGAGKDAMVLRAAQERLRERYKTPTVVAQPAEGKLQVIEQTNN